MIFYFKVYYDFHFLHVKFIIAVKSTVEIGYRASIHDSYVYTVCCNPTIETKSSTTPVNVDLLTAIFLAGWNNKDSAAIMNTLADNAIVMNDSLIHNGHLAIANNWISGGGKVFSSIKTSSVIKDSDNRIAYNGGMYSLDLTPTGGQLFPELLALWGDTYKIERETKLKKMLASALILYQQRFWRTELYWALNFYLVLLNHYWAAVPGRTSNEFHTCKQNLLFSGNATADIP